MEVKQLFQQAQPNAFFLESTLSTEFKTYLASKSWFAKDETITSLSKPGEGNMNFVLRVKTNKRTFILKQARPWVEKYPQIAAPIRRIEVEAEFYKRISNNAFLGSFSPRILHYDRLNFILALEDLGQGADFTSLYKKGQTLDSNDLAQFIAYLNQLHTLRPTAKKAPYPANSGMKQLNHIHIFHYPFLENNGFDLDTVQKGLQTLALPYKQNTVLKDKIEKLGTLYLVKGDTLIHGDFYPGSWLKVPSGVKVIDPEFSYFGCREFDIAVILAHLKMAQADEAQINAVLEAYQFITRFNQSTIWAFVGIEIMRRLIGLAQLPLDLTLAEKEALLAEASAYILAY
jgi:5-methylthioribose kinase